MVAHTHGTPSAMQRQGRPGYLRRTVSLAGGPVQTAEGTELDTMAIDQFREFDTIIVPGVLDIEPVLAKQGLVEWLGHAALRIPPA